MKDLFGSDIVPVKAKESKPKKVVTSIREASKKVERKPVFIEVTKVNPNYSVSYAREVTGFFSGSRSKQPKYNAPDPGMSDKGRRRLGSALNWMILFSTNKTVYSVKEKRQFTFKVNFITLTLSDRQQHSDHYIKQHMLAPFLKWMERSAGAVSYIWKAEAQDNGNIHFHITTNQFIHWKSVRSKWNKLLAKHGYCKVFQDGTNDKGNAATQIKSVRAMNTIVGYMQGYITKKDLYKKKVSTMCPADAGPYGKLSYRQAVCEDGMMKEYKRQIAGKVWSTSHNLSKINCFISMEDGVDYFNAAGSLLAKGSVIMANKYLTVRKHNVLRSKDMHPLLLQRLRDIKERHFVNDIQPKKIRIQSFY